jgi:DNA-directed RNA polymerase subunit omega
MADRRNNTLMDPPIEDLLDKVDSKFTLVALSSKRARQINSYYNQLGEGMGMVVPPQVTSVSGKPLTIAFEEISAAKATYHRLEPGELDAIEGAAIGADGLPVGADPLLAVDPLTAVDILEAVEATPEVIAEAADAEIIAEADAVLEEAALEDPAAPDSAPAADAAEQPVDE